MLRPQRGVAFVRSLCGYTSTRVGRAWVHAPFLSLIVIKEEGFMGNSNDRKETTINDRELT